MKKQYIIILAIALSITFCLVSCKKYLDIKPKGKVVLSQVKDYDLWLNSEELLSISENFLTRMCDTYDEPNLNAANRVGQIPEESTYLWFDQFILSEIRLTSPVFWGKHYQHIFLYNAVVNGIDAATGLGQENKARLKAEAMLGRAFEYLYLVNLYAKVYDANTAATDLAVPIVEGTDVNQMIPNRSTVKQVYDYILDNLNKAIPDLPADNASNRYRGSQAAAYSVMARTYLLMGAYEKASQNAEMALSISNTKVPDMNDYVDDFSFGYPRLTRGSSEIFSRRGSTYYDEPIVNLDFLNSLSREDIRYLRYYTDVKYGDPVEADSTVYHTRGSISYVPGGYLGNNTTNFGTSAVEMQFIKAEYAARKGDLSAALTILNDEIKAKRYLNSSFQPYSSDDREEVLAEIFKERKFEFPFSGLRWFDMRRLDHEGKMVEVKRYALDGKTVIANLPPKSSKYTLKIPTVVLLYHPDMKQN